MKSWRCAVCGYIHKGDNPLEKCPRCGAPKENFIEMVEETSAVETIHMHYGQKVVYGEQPQVNPFL